MTYTHLPNGIVIDKFRVCGSEGWVYQAWEPSGLMREHSTITFIDGECYGRIGTNPDKAKYDHLKGGSDERIKAVRAAYQEQYQRAYAAIREAYPAAKGREECGEIVEVK